MRFLGVVLVVLLWVVPSADARQRSSGGQGYGYANPNPQYVGPSVTRNGQLRSGHFRTSPNYTDKDTYSTSGNTNPWTGKRGSRSSKNPW